MPSLDFHFSSHFSLGNQIARAHQDTENETILDLYCCNGTYPSRYQRVTFATAPIPAPMAETVAVPMERILGTKPTAAAVVMPVMPAPATVTATGTAPPAAMLWAVANMLPATTFPIPACIPAAADPDRVPVSSRG